MSSPDDPSSSSHLIIPTLRLTSLDPDELWIKLSAVEKALPHLLLCLKPILAQLGSSPSTELTSVHPLSASLRDQTEMGGEAGDKGAKGAVGDYMEILDEIQEVLRNAALYLRKTNASPGALRPPPTTSIPTPFASTIPSNSPLDPSSSTTTATATGNGSAIGSMGEVELGLYASRIEARVLGDMMTTLEEIKLEEELKKQVMPVLEKL